MCRINYFPTEHSMKTGNNKIDTQSVFKEFTVLGADKGIRHTLGGYRQVHKQTNKFFSKLSINYI